MKKYDSTAKIARVEITDDTITGRGGLALFSRYLTTVGILKILGIEFKSLRKSSKGKSIEILFKQIFCWLMDGTSRHLTYFDHLKSDSGYAATLELNKDDLASSHTMKRFFKSFWIGSIVPFRKILSQLFSWRLKIDLPRIIELTIDTMVMDNDEAKVRHGVKPTYKKKLGFQPLQAIWNGFIVDAIFRNGKKNGNAGDEVQIMIRRLVKLIRESSPKTKLIVFRFDAGFFDQSILKLCNELGIGCIMSGKMYQTIKDHVAKYKKDEWRRYDNDRQSWEYIDFYWGCNDWDDYYRTLYTRPIYENGKMLLEFARPDNVIITNLDDNCEILKYLSVAEQKKWEDPEKIITSHHGRGSDELPHRGLKDFGFEALPFKHFGPNTAVYYCMVIAFFLFESFKRDTLDDIIPIKSYASTVRRRVIDIAAKFIKTSGQTILKVTREVMNAMDFNQIWERCKSAQPIMGT